MTSIDSLWQEQRIVLHGSSDSQPKHIIFNSTSGAMGALGGSWMGTKLLVNIWYYQVQQQSVKSLPDNAPLNYDM